MASNHTLDNYTHIKHYLVGGIPTPLKNISQLESLFLIYGKIKNAPNHQPVIIYIYTQQYKTTILQPRPWVAIWIYASSLGFNSRYS